ncbi:MAG: DNA-directed RNA polymerase subunit B'' [archaeon]|nr:MAG: DNA-directed RNA polymerase subunit B'' [archaeon]
MLKSHLLVKKCLEQHSLVESNIRSYNDFIDRRLQEIVDAINEDIPRDEVELWLGRASVGKPRIIEADGSIREVMPIEARLRKITYSAPVYLEIGVGGKEYTKVEMGSIPVMVKSKVCNLTGMGKEELIKNHEDPSNPGGYFIINGNNRALMMMEELAQNQPFVEETPKGTMLRLFSQRGSYRIPVTVSEATDGTIVVNFSRFKNIPAILLAKALGVTKDAEIAQLIGKESDTVIVNFYEYSSVGTSEEAFLKIAELMSLQGTQKEILDRVKLRTDSAFLPHIGTTKDARKEKGTNLCKLIKLFLLAKDGELKIDKDHYANKRVKLSGDLLTDLFRVNLTIFIRDLQHSLQKIARRKKFYSIKSLAKSTLFSHRIESAFATGNWIGERAGVTQNLENDNFLTTLAQLQRVKSLLPNEQENFKARTLHPTQYGRFCPIETPEGPTIGLRKNLSILARVSTNVSLNDKELRSILEKAGMQKTGKADIYFNGKFIGNTDEPKKLIETIKEKRRAAELPRELSVRHAKGIDSIFLSTEVGRVIRPLIIVKEGKSKFSEEIRKELREGKTGWDELVQKGIIEYIDAAEEDNAYVTLDEKELTPEHTHLEIDAIAMFGLITALVPFGDHDHAARLNKVGRALKQALGIYSANFLDLLDTDVSILHYPQKPIVRSFVYDNIDLHPSGQNVIVAIMPYQGYNMSDAIVMNKGSVERGLARSTFFRPYGATELHYTGNLRDKIGIPQKDVQGYRTEKTYQYLEDDGIVYPEAGLKAEDVVLGKVSPPKFMLEMEEISLAKAKKESSMVIRQGEKGCVDAVFVSVDGEGRKMSYVRMRDSRNPEIGDKFASPHGQKGVIGMIAPEEDLPFTSQGIRPDVIFNPHGIPARLTVGYLLELLAGKMGCLSGQIVDGTAFNNMKPEELEGLLLKLGFRKDGKETLYDGVTGKPLDAKIFIGNMYYHKLKYMVANKIQARATGKVTLLTRQPVEGRAKAGALRLGEMEKDALVAHGSSLLLKERFSSDNVKVYVCSKCGMVVGKSRLKKKSQCPMCGSHRLEAIEVSYASKLLMEELTSLHVNPKLILKNKYED